MNKNILPILKIQIGLTDIKSLKTGWIYKNYILLDNNEKNKQLLLIITYFKLVSKLLIRKWRLLLKRYEYLKR